MLDLTKRSKRYDLTSFNAGHFFEDLREHEGFYVKKFFGGLSIYVYGKMVAFLCERAGTQDYRGKHYAFDIWDGCLIACSREHHDALMAAIEGCVVHPVIQKWVYLPTQSPHFEDSMLKIVEMVRKQNPMVGVEPELRAKTKRKR